MSGRRPEKNGVPGQLNSRRIQQAIVKPKRMNRYVPALLCKNTRRQKDRYGLQHEDFGKNVESAG